MKNQKFLLLITLAASLVMVGACGDDDSTEEVTGSITEEVDEDGGTISSEGGGASLEFPAGAVSEPTEITIETHSPPDRDDAKSNLYRFATDADLEEAVTVTIELFDDMDAQGVQLARFDGDEPEAVSGSSVEDNAVTASLARFSMYGAFFFEDEGSDFGPDAAPHEAIYETTFQQGSDDSCEESDFSELEGVAAFDDYFALNFRATPEGDYTGYQLKSCTSTSLDDCDPIWFSFWPYSDPDHDYVEEGLISIGYGYLNQNQIDDECHLYHQVSTLEATGDGSVRASHYWEDVKFDVNDVDFNCEDYSGDYYQEHDDPPSVFDDAECTSMDFMLEGDLP